MKNSCYVDAPSEKASVFILKQLGYEIVSGVHGSALPWTKEQLFREHKSANDVFLKLVHGSASVELRDVSNSWIRLDLDEGETIKIPANAYRKIIIDDLTKFSVESAASCDILTFRFTEDADSVEVLKYHSYRELVCELCQQFFQAGWVTGTGGSISIKYGNRIYMTPSGVQKERIKPDELFVLDPGGNILSVPKRKPDFMCPKLSDCAPLFLHAYQIRNAGAVLHSHSFSTNLITSMFEGKPEFRISHQEMIKGITGHGYYDELVVPIIENTAWEHELADKLGETIQKYPKTFAVLVRRHGMYVWGNTWEQAKRHGECYHYLFEIAIKMRSLNLDFTRPPIIAPVNSSAPISGLKNKYKHVVFDIEGTVAPISYIKDVLFPFSVDNVKTYLETTWSTSQTQEDVNEIFHQYDNDILSSDYAGPTLLKSSDKATQISSLENYVKWCVSIDRKVSALKQLQGHIWEVGYEEGKLKSSIFDDVPNAFKSLTQKGSQIAIYSSGSRVAQSLLFKYSIHGDLREHISVFFDTKIGHKREKTSYDEICMYFGVDSPDEILFVTDVYEEASAADAAGIHVLISVREGNAPLPENNKFPTVTSFESL